MPSVQMTDAAVKRLNAPPGQRIEYFDQAMRGLCLRVSAPTQPSKEARRSWCLYYRNGGRLIRLTLGTYPALSLAEARAEASKAQALKRRGTDPATAKAAEARAAAEAASHEPDTIDSLIAQYISRGLEDKRRSPRYVIGTRRNFDNHVLTRWRGRDIHSITRRDVIKLLDDIKDNGSDIRRKGKRCHIEGGAIAANRVLAAIRGLFNFAIRRGIVEANPATLIERPGEETRRDRVLNLHELAAVWSAADAAGYPFGRFFQIVLLTGQRRSEVAGMRWSDIDLEAATWTLPAEQTKASRLHIVPLAPLTVELLKTVPRMSVRGTDGKLRPSTHVFTSERDRPISGFSPAKRRLDAAIAKAGNPVEPWTIHDLRRTAASEMARLGVSQFVVGKVLNHTDRSVTGIYNRYDYLNEKRHALEQWAAYLGNLTNPPPQNVVALLRA